MPEDNLHGILEALLFASDNPLSVKRIKELFPQFEGTVIRNTLNKLKDDYEKNHDALEIVEVGGGYQIVSKKEYAPYIQLLYKGRMASRLTQRAMETLAIIAYKQPITKQEIEAIRGVNVDGVVKTLLERDLIMIKGRQKAPGNPLLYGTSRKFLIYFGLKSLNDLPKLKEIDELLKDDNKFLESLDQVALEQLAPESLGIKNIGTMREQTSLPDTEEKNKSEKNDEIKNENDEVE
jgi:segregation and condensation protein B